jgi:hypothetical protein
MNISGIERIAQHYKDEIYTRFNTANNVPDNAQAYATCTEIIEKMSIGQLYTLANMSLDRFNTIKLHSIDNEFTVYLDIVGLYGGLDADGSIHT